LGVKGGIGYIRYSILDTSNPIYILVNPDICKYLPDTEIISIDRLEVNGNKRGQRIAPAMVLNEIRTQNKPIIDEPRWRFNPISGRLYERLKLLSNEFGINCDTFNARCWHPAYKKRYGKEEITYIFYNKK